MKILLTEHRTSPILYESTTARCCRRGETMKNLIKRIAREEHGSVLTIALILLVVGGLLLAPLLGLMSTGLVSGQVYEKKTAELYAADAGVEAAIWAIRADNLTWSGNHSELGPLAVNEKTVDVEVHRYVVEGTTGCDKQYAYHILSIASDPNGGSSTTVEAHIELLFFDLFHGALVSSRGITFSKDTKVTGDVYYVTNIDGKEYDHIDGKEMKVSADVFPSQEDNEAFAQKFKDQALLGGTYEQNNGNMSVSGSQELGPIYIPGDLSISGDLTLTLTGVVYVKGGVRGENTLTIVGQGSIVAEGEIYFKKLADYAVTGDSVIMSLYDGITLKKSDPNGELSIEALVYAPNGTIEFDKDITVVGSVIGAGIKIDKEGFFQYVAKASSFDFPVLVIYGAGIKTYTIS